MLTLFENWEQVGNYARISENAYGTAEEKMEAFTDSVEAAQNRVQSAIEGWALFFDGAEAMKLFNNVLAEAIENIDILIATIGTVALVANAPKVGNALMGVTTKAGQYAARTSNSMMNFFSARAMDANAMENTTNSMWKNIKDSYIQSTQDAYINQMQKNIKSLSDEDKLRATTLAQDLMNSELKDRENYYAAMNNEMLVSSLTIGKTNQEQESLYSLTLKKKVAGELQALTIEERNTLLEKLKGQTTDEATKTLIDQITAGTKVTLSQNDLEKINNLLVEAKQKEYQAVVKSTQAEYSQAMGEDATGKVSDKAVTRGIFGGIGSIASEIVGTFAGGSIGSMFGDTGTMVGSLLGGSILNGLNSYITGTTFTSGLKASSSTILQSLGGLLASNVAPIIGPLLVGGFTALWAYVTSQQKKHLEELANTFQEESDRYSEMTGALSKVSTYDKYIEGVDRLGKNVSLTTDEYNSWLEANNALAEIFPDMILYTDEQGNSIVGLDGKVQSLTDSINEMVDAQQNAADMALLEPDLFNASYNEAKKSYDSAKDSYEDWQALLEAIDSSTYKYNSKRERSEFDIGDSKLALDYANMLRGQGYSAYASQTNLFVDIDPDKEAELLSELRSKAIEQMDNFEHDMEQSTSSISDQVNAMFRQFVTGNLDDAFEFDYDEYDDSIAKMFEDISTEELSAMKEAVNSLGLDEEAENYGQTVLNTITDLHKKIKENPLIMDYYIQAQDAETTGDYRIAKENLKKTLINAFGSDFATWSESAKAFVIQLGFEITEDGLVDSSNTFEKIKDLLDVSNLGIGVTQDWFDSLTLEESNRVFEYFRNNVVDATTHVQTLQNLLYADRETSGLNEEMQKINEQLTTFETLGSRVQTFYENFEGDDLAKSVTSSFSDIPEAWRNLIEEGYDDWLEGGEDAGDAFVAGLMDQLYDSNLTSQYESYLAELAQVSFPDLEFDGYIDSFSELKDAMDSIASSYDMLKSAQEEYNETGKLSWSTILDLVSANTQYVNALNITKDGITLKTNAEQIMIQTQLTAVKANINAAISELENRNAILQTALQKLQQGQDVNSVANIVVNSANTEIAAIDQTTEAWIKAGKAAAAYNSVVTGDMTLDQYNGLVGDITTSSVTTAKASGTGVSGVSGVSKAGKELGTSVGKSISDSLEDLNIFKNARDLINGTSDIWDSYAIKPEWSAHSGNSSFYGASYKDTEAMSLMDQIQDEIDYNNQQIATYKAFLQNVESVINGDQSFGDMYNPADTGGSKSGADDDIESAKKYLETLQALQNLINKEWEDMLAFQKGTDSAYYGKMRENLTAQLEEVNRLLDNFDAYLAAGSLEESDYNDLLQQQIELQVEINNLDDEQVEEAIDLLQTQEASIYTQIEAQKQLLATSDTMEEYISRQKELLWKNIFLVRKSLMT